MPSNQIVNLAGLRLFVQGWGGGEYPPLFMLHGLASTSHMFDLIAEPLTDRYRVFAYDQRGHGLSDKPSTGYDFEAIARDLDDLADALGYQNRPLTLVGHSWGAYSTLYYAATRPARAAKAVLIDGGVRPLQDLFPTWTEGEIGLAPPPYVNLSVEDIRQRIRRWQGVGFRPETEPLAMTIFDLSDPHHVHARLSRDNNMQIARALWEFQPSDYFRRVHCPLLIVNAVEPGQPRNPQIEHYTQLAVQSAKDAAVVWMNDTIHDIPWHRPEELGAVLSQFL
ncbi:MAG: alpha/beta hydrolase [Anaerolineae bacterium]|nr:alpha/beta hydrolase [Anaerolineae bacterium]NUQ05170.1 alpha/beta hydrolase [Anaerolineae bacterium]